MKVKELIEQLQKFDPEMDVVDYGCDTFESVHLKTVIDSDYPHEYKDHIAVCVDIEDVAYCYWVIIDEIKNFLGEEGYKYFNDGEDTFDKKYYFEGRQIRNHIIDKFPNVVKWLGSYQMFEDEMYEWTKRAVSI